MEFCTGLHPNYELVEGGGVGGGGSNETKVRCLKCGKAVHKKYMNTHLETHLRKPFTCVPCHKLYQTFELLKRHLNSKTCQAHVFIAREEANVETHFEVQGEFAFDLIDSRWCANSGSLRVPPAQMQPIQAPGSALCVLCTSTTTSSSIICSLCT